jgi:small subunit ribosomal protein S19
MRSSWKNPFIDLNLIKDIQNTKKNHTVEIFSRKSIILPQYISLKAAIYNGKKFITRTISEEMVGKKFGEFSLTRSKYVHKKKKKK